MHVHFRRAWRNAHGGSDVLVVEAKEDKLERLHLTLGELVPFGVELKVAFDRRFDVVVLSRGRVLVAKGERPVGAYA